jgi:hypothetical protein
MAWRPHVAGLLHFAIVKQDIHRPFVSSTVASAAVHLPVPALSFRCPESRGRILMLSPRLAIALGSHLDKNVLWIDAHEDFPLEIGEIGRRKVGRN